MKEKEYPSVGVLLIEGNNVLLVQHKERAGHITGIFGLPSGKPHRKESKEKAAVRELREETGFITSLDALVLIPKKYTARIEGKHSLRLWNWTVFLCRKWGGELTQSTETIPVWVPIDTVTNYPLLPNVADASSEGLMLMLR